MLHGIKNWKDFERLSADLLDAEGFKVYSEPSVDTDGVDFRAKETFRSHAGHEITVDWQVQCKHYALSNESLTRPKIASILNDFQASRRANEGLFIITSSDYTQPAVNLIEKHTEAHPDSRITLWNRRHVTARLERHPELLRRYGLSLAAANYLDMLSSIKEYSSTNILLISDQSALAHNLASVFRSTGFNLHILPFWNYEEIDKMTLFRNSFLTDEIGLIVLFLGDSFVRPLPDDLVDLLSRTCAQGASFLLFPFLAWSMKRKLYSALSPVVPVEVIEPSGSLTDREDEMFLGEYRKGDFRWLLAADTFAEDRYMELDPSKGSKGFTAGIDGKFGFSHSFEFLQSVEGAEVELADTTGNPFVITKKLQRSRICYINSCCHCCMSTVPVVSPLETSESFAILMRNSLAWLLKEKHHA